MPKSKPIIVEPQGLITAPNKLGQYSPGAMLVDIGVLHNAAGSHETAPKFTTFTSVSDDDDYEAVEIIPLPTKWTLLLIKKAGEWGYRWLRNTDHGISAWTKAVHAYAPDGAVFEIDGRINWVITRDRVFVTTTTGPMVFDYLDPVLAHEFVPRLAGMFSPAISTEAISGTGAGALHAGKQAHTVAVVTRHFPDCYEVSGAPSAAVQTFAEGDAEEDAEADRRNLSITVYQRPGHPQLLPGDMVEVYRTYQTPRPAPGDTPEDYDQGTSTTADYYMSSIFTIPEGGGSSWTWTEATGDLSLGEALYTNQGVVGASAQKRPPPIARVIEEYRGYTFYFDITEPPARVARAAGGMGQLTDDWSDTWGIGTRDEVADEVEINGDTFELGQADDLASTTIVNVDDLARVNPDTPGEWTQPATGFAFRFDYAGFGDFTIRASNGQNYNPPLPLLSEDAELVSRPRRKNGMMWTENGQPEAVVAAGLVGKGQVYAACATSQAMVIWTEFGIHRLTGTGGSSSAGFDWGMDQIDTQCLLRGPKAYCRLGDNVFCASNNGAVVIDAGGMVREISTAALGDTGRAQWSQDDKTRVIPDESSGDVYFCFDGDPYAYVYSTRWNKWSRVRIAEDEVASSFANLQYPIIVAELVDGVLEVKRASADTYQTSIVRMQPTSDGDPSSLKRWIEVEWYFHASAVGAPVTFICNEMEGMERTLEKHEGGNVPSAIQAGISTVAQGAAADFSLSMCWMEVPTDAPAVSNTISLGYVTPEGPTKYTFFGCAITNNHSTQTTHNKRGAAA